jgi:glycosyltransferase involved in cell wall biosynthesis
VFHLTNWLPSYHQSWGGAEQACLQTVKLLAEKGVENFILTTPLDKHPSDSFKMLEVVTLEDYLDPVVGQKLRQIKTIFWPYDYFVYFQLRRLLRQYNPDLIHLHNFKYLSLAPIMVAADFGLPVVSSIYDYWYFCPKDTLLDKSGLFCQSQHSWECSSCCDFKRFKNFKKWLIQLRPYFFKRALHKISVFIALSKASARQLERRGIDSKKIEIIPQAIEINTSTGEEGLVKPASLLYVGWLDPNKGLHILIEALSLIKNEIPTVRVSVIGEAKNTAYLNYVKQRVKELELEEQIRFLGRQSFAVVANYLRQTQVVVVPEQWENMSPLFLLEAMRFGKPVVASRIGGIPEFIKDGQNGYLVNAKRPAEFAARIRELILNGEIAAKFGRQAKQDFERIFNRQKIAYKLLNLYNRLTDKTDSLSYTA